MKEITALCLEIIKISLDTSGPSIMQCQRKEVSMWKQTALKSMQSKIKMKQAEKNNT